MSSPFNPLSALSPNPSGTPLSLALGGLAPSALPAGEGLSPHPFLAHAAASPAVGTPGGGGQTPWLQLVSLAPGGISLGGGGTGLTPAAGPGAGGAVFMTPGGGTLQPLQPMGMMPGQVPLPGQLQAVQQQQQMAGPSAQAAQDADETVRAVPDISRLLERAEAVRTEISALEKGLFVKGEGAERAGALCRLEALQLDYAQTLFALISLSSTYLVGALPLNLSAVAEPTPAPGAPAAAATVQRTPTTAELANWTEARAQTMFARREAVRGAARAVGDVLKGVKQ